jgi:hypothetical protein
MMKNMLKTLFCHGWFGHQIAELAKFARFATEGALRTVFYIFIIIILSFRSMK